MCADVNEINKNIRSHAIHLNVKVFGNLWNSDIQVNIASNLKCIFFFMSSKTIIFGVPTHSAY